MCDKKNEACTIIWGGRNRKYQVDAMQSEYDHRQREGRGMASLPVNPPPPHLFLSPPVSLSTLPLSLSLSGFPMAESGGSLYSYATDRDHGQFRIKTLFNEIIMPGPKCHVYRLRLFTPTSL